MAKPPAAPVLPFANDGSFMEQFMKVRRRTRIFTRHDAAALLHTPAAPFAAR